MPAKSKAQAGKMAILYKEGKITRQQLRDMVKGVDVKHLPKRVRRKKKK